MPASYLSDCVSVHRNTVTPPHIPNAKLTTLKSTPTPTVRLLSEHSGHWLLDERYELVTNRKMGINLVYRGYAYRRKASFRNTVNWVCARAAACPARVVTNGEGAIKLSRKWHDHGPQSQFDDSAGAGLSATASSSVLVHTGAATLQRTKKDGPGRQRHKPSTKHSYILYQTASMQCD